MKTMVRKVYDDFHALLMCNAMESVGGRPFSVVYVPAHKTGHFPHYDMAAAWHVFGQVPDEDAMLAVDGAFDALVSPGTATST
jgi:hypothetical protein